jgi:cardiolipin synthase A/B
LSALGKAEFFPAPFPQGDKVVRVIGSSPDHPERMIYLTLLSAISNADRSIYLTMAYFVPDAQTIDALKQAVRRGVDVKVILPQVSDFWVVLEAGRSYYSDLLRAGVKIYERRDALLHAKTAVIDGVWSTVGSANMDLRSFLHNYEVNAIVLGDEFGRQMYSMFKADLEHSAQIDLAQWESRPFTRRLKERLARMWQYWL